jgi:EpsI family protein
VQAELAGQPVSVSAESLRDRRASLVATGQRLRVWRFYWVDDRFTASDFQAKLLGARSLIRARGDDGAIVVLYTTIDPDLPGKQGLERSDQVLREFLQANGESLRSMLRQTRGEI